jgi:ASC-1-like (ASCH) protein
MQHNRKDELIVDILENAIAVLRRERELHGRPVGDVIINLETASVLVQDLRQERSPFQTLRENPFEKLANYDRSMQERHPIDREAARKGFTE